MTSVPRHRPLKSWPRHSPPDFSPVSILKCPSNLWPPSTTSGTTVVQFHDQQRLSWPMGVTKATHLISWSDALIQDYLAKLEILGSTVAPFLNLNGAHFGSLLSPERHFSSPYLGLQSVVSRGGRCSLFLTMRCF